MNQTPAVTITQANLEALVKTQNEILRLLRAQQSRSGDNPNSSYVTAKEFMDSVYIKRTKFDQLVAENKIRIVKKTRRIYVPATEIGRYFADPDFR